MFKRTIAFLVAWKENCLSLFSELIQSMCDTEEKKVADYTIRHWLTSNRKTSQASALLSRSIRHVDWHRAKRVSNFFFVREENKHSTRRVCVYSNRLTHWKHRERYGRVFLFLCQSAFLSIRSDCLSKNSYRTREKRKGNSFFHWTREIETSERKRIGGKCLFPDEKEKKKRNLIGFLSPTLLKSDLPTIMISEIRKRKFHWMIRTKQFPYWHLAQHRTMISSPDFLPRMTTPLPGWIYEQKVSDLSDKKVGRWKFRFFISHLWCVGPFSRWQLIEIFV